MGVCLSDGSDGHQQRTHSMSVCDIALYGEKLKQVEQGSLFVREGGCKEDVIKTSLHKSFTNFRL